MGVITTGQDFSSGDQVTSTKLNDIANQATFTSAADTTDDSTLTISGGKLKVADDGIGSTQLASDASTDTNRAVQTNHIRDDAVTQDKIADDSVGNNQLDDSGVTAATYTNATIAVNDQGRITSASNGSTGTSMGVPTTDVTGTLNTTTSFADKSLASAVGANRAYVMIMFTGGSAGTQFFIRPKGKNVEPSYPAGDAPGVGASGTYLEGVSGKGGILVTVTDDSGVIQHKGNVLSNTISYEILAYEVLA